MRVIVDKSNYPIIKFPTYEPTLPTINSNDDSAANSIGSSNKNQLSSDYVIGISIAVSIISLILFAVLIYYYHLSKSTNSLLSSSVAVGTEIVHENLDIEIGGENPMRECREIKEPQKEEIQMKEIQMTETQMTETQMTETQMTETQLSDEIENPMYVADDGNGYDNENQNEFEIKTNGSEVEDENENRNEENEN